MESYLDMIDVFATACILTAIIAMLRGDKLFSAGFLLVSSLCWGYLALVTDSMFSLVFQAIIFILCIQRLRWLGVNAAFFEKVFEWFQKGGEFPKLEEKKLPVVVIKEPEDMPKEDELKSESEIIEPDEVKEDLSESEDNTPK